MRLPYPYRPFSLSQFKSLLQVEESRRGRKGGGTLFVSRKCQLQPMKNLHAWGVPGREVPVGDLQRSLLHHLLLFYYGEGGFEWDI